MAVKGPDGYTMLISPNRGSCCIMLSLPGVYCCVHTSGTFTHCWVMWLIFVRFTLSVVVNGDEEHDEWKDLVQCDRLWLISPIQTPKALPHSGHWWISWGGGKKITLDLRTSRFLSVSLSYSILLKEDSAFVDFAPLKVCERKEIFTRHKMRLLSSNLP